MKTRSYHEIETTLGQFSHGQEWVLTKAGKFTDKAALFPNSVFIIGADTLTRILDEKFYLNREDMLNQLDLFNSHNINFLVFGRKIKSNFIDSYGFKKLAILGILLKYIVIT